MHDIHGGFGVRHKTTLAENFHWWVTAWFLSLDGPTVAQLGGVILALTVCEFRAIFSVLLFHHSNNLIVSRDDTLDK